MIRVFYADVSGLDPDSPDIIGLVPPKRAEKASRYLRRADRALSVGVELVLNYGAALAAPGLKRPVLYEADANGKPYAPGCPFHFNLSHSGSMAVCAIADVPVGVDVERECGVTLDVARNYFFGSEYQAIVSSSRPGPLFFDYWVLKESYMKAVGLGFALPLDAFCVRINGGVSVYQAGVLAPYEFALTRLEGGYHLAVCAQSGAGEAVFEPVGLNALVDAASYGKRMKGV